MARSHAAQFSRNVGRAVAQAKDSLHPLAAGSLVGNEEAVRDWLRLRQEVILSGRGRVTETLVVHLNALDQRGYGLQSLSVGARDKHGHRLLLKDPFDDEDSENEWKDPTLGFLMMGMLADRKAVQVGEMEFDLNPGDGELLANIGDTCLALRVVSAKTGRQSSQQKHPFLRPGYSIEARGPNQALRLGMETVHQPKQRISSAILRATRGAIGGVYACEFVRRKSVER